MKSKTYGFIIKFKPKATEKARLKVIENILRDNSVAEIIGRIDIEVNDKVKMNKLEIKKKHK